MLPLYLHFLLSLCFIVFPHPLSRLLSLVHLGLNRSSPLRIYNQRYSRSSRNNAVCLNQVSLNKTSFFLTLRRHPEWVWITFIHIYSAYLALSTLLWNSISLQGKRAYYKSAAYIFRLWEEWERQKERKKVDILRDKTEGEHTKRTSKQNRLRNQAESTPPLPHQDDTKMNIFFPLWSYSCKFMHVLFERALGIPM